MRLRMSRNRTVAAGLVLLAGILCAVPASANCQGVTSVVSWTGGGFTGCGNNAEGFFWLHRMGVQRIVSTTSPLSNNTGGLDSGSLDPHAVPGGTLTPGAVAGDYTIATDWGNPGVDGCIANSDVREGDAADCSGGPGSFPPMNFIIAGMDSGQPGPGPGGCSFRRLPGVHLLP